MSRVGCVVRLSQMRLPMWADSSVAIAATPGLVGLRRSLARGMLARQCAPSSIPPWSRLQRVGLDGTFELLPQFRVVLPEVAVDSLVGEQFGLVTLGEHPIQHILAAGH